MRVLQLISSIGYYGAEAVVINLSKGLKELGIANTIGVFRNAHRPNLEVAEVARRLELPVEIVPCSGRVDWQCVRTIREIVERERIDLIHTHGYKTNLYAYLAARLRPVALVATCHLWTRDRVALRIYGMMDQALLRRFGRVVAVSGALADSLRRAHVAPERLAVIDNGIDLEGLADAAPSADLEHLKAGRFALGVVGRLTEQKGHEYLFRALQPILKQSPQWVLFVVGDGPLKSQLETQARELGIESSVVFTGKRGDMANVYAALDLFVLPSLYEGLPIAVLEALAAKKAVIATRVGAVSEVVLDGKTGLLIEPADTEALQNAILRLAADAGLRQTLGENGAALVSERFSAQSMTAKYLQVYQTLVD